MTGSNVGFNDTLPLTDFFILEDTGNIKYDNGTFVGKARALTEHLGSVISSINLKTGMLQKHFDKKEFVVTKSAILRNELDSAEEKIPRLEAFVASMSKEPQTVELKNRSSALDSAIKELKEKIQSTREFLSKI